MQSAAAQINFRGTRLKAEMFSLPVVLAPLFEEVFVCMALDTF